MTPADIDRVFGRGRLRMVTGDHVEVFREASLPGERRRYTKRFLATAAGDFSEWTEREWRILARLVGHGIKPVPDVVRFDRGAADRAALVQTYDAGVTVDHWATLLPLERDGKTLRNVFEDCAHWWALARHSLVALDAIHELRLVHLDLKADNVCIPVGPADFDPRRARVQTMHPRFDDIALIDFAFSLVSGERLDSALPIAQQAEYEYQSPRLLRALEAGRDGDLAPTRQLDWRCDLFSLAAMLWRYLPELEDTTTGAWSRPRHAKARALVRRLIEVHDAALPVTRPHAELIALAAEPLEKSADLRESLQRGWTLAIDGPVAVAATPTPITRIALPVATPITVPMPMPMPTPTPMRDGATVGREGTVSAPVAPVPPTVPIAAVPPIAPIALRAAARERAAPPRGEPDFGAREPLAVDPTEVAIRLQARRRERLARTRKLAWGAGLTGIAAAAAAAVALLQPAWLAPQEELDLHVALAAPTRPASTGPASRGEERVAVAPLAPSVASDRSDAPAQAPKEAAPKLAHDAAPSLAAEVATAPSAPAATSSGADGAIEAAAPTPQATPDDRTMPAPPALPSRSAVDIATPSSTPPGKRAPADSAAAPSPVTAAGRSRADASPARTVTRGRAVAPPPSKAMPTQTRTARAQPAATPSRAARAAPAPGPTRVVRGSATPLPATRSMPAPTRLAGTVAPRRSAAATPGPALDAPIPWAVAGRAAPGPDPTGAAAASQRPTAPTASPAAQTSAALPATPRAPSVAPPGPSTPTAPEPAPTTTTAAAPVGPTSTAPAPGPAGDVAPVDYAARASDLMAHQVPRAAQRAERLVARVLFVAGRADGPPGGEDVRAAAAAVRRDAGDSFSSLPVAAREAQRLGEAARAEYARRGGTSEALLLQARAFGANPLDAEAAGNLAFLLLRQRPAQPEAARQLALHALTLQGARHPEGRIEDWATFAIASALVGRERDARNAFLVVLTLAPDVDHQCKAALDVYALYGERLRVPVESMLQSANASGRVRGPSSCEYPPRWTLTGGPMR